MTNETNVKLRRDDLAWRARTIIYNNPQQFASAAAWLLGWSTKPRTRSPGPTDDEFGPDPKPGDPFYLMRWLHKAKADAAYPSGYGQTGEELANFTLEDFKRWALLGALMVCADFDATVVGLPEMPWVVVSETIQDGRAWTSFCADNELWPDEILARAVERLEEELKARDVVHKSNSGENQQRTALARELRRLETLFTTSGAQNPTTITFLTVNGWGYPGEGHGQIAGSALDKRDHLLASVELPENRGTMVLLPKYVQVESGWRCRMLRDGLTDAQTSLPEQCVDDQLVTHPDSPFPKPWGWFDPNDAKIENAVLWWGGTERGRDRCIELADRAFRTIVGSGYLLPADYLDDLRTYLTLTSNPHPAHDWIVLCYHWVWVQRVGGGLSAPRKTWHNGVTLNWQTREIEAKKIARMMPNAIGDVSKFRHFYSIFNANTFDVSAQVLAKLAEVIEQQIPNSEGTGTSNEVAAKVVAAIKSDPSVLAKTVVKKRRRKPTLNPQERPLTPLEVKTLEVVGRHRQNFAAAARELGRDTKTVRENYNRALAKSNRISGHQSRSVGASKLPTDARSQPNPNRRGG